MTNPDNVGGLEHHVPAPLSEELRVEAALHDHGPTQLRLSRMADRAERLEELCRAAPAGYRPYGGDPAEPRDDSDRYDSAPAGGGAAGCGNCDGHGEVQTGECVNEDDYGKRMCPECNGSGFDSATAGAEEVERLAKFLDNMSNNNELEPRERDDLFNATALLRKLQQGADGARMFTHDDLPEASHSTTVGNGTYLHCYLGREVIDIVNNHIAASQGQEVDHG